MKKKFILIRLNIFIFNSIHNMLRRLNKCFIFKNSFRTILFILFIKLIRNWCRILIRFWTFIEFFSLKSFFIILLIIWRHRQIINSIIYLNIFFLTLWFLSRAHHSRLRWSFSNLFSIINLLKSITFVQRIINRFLRMIH